MRKLTVTEYRAQRCIRAVVLAAGLSAVCLSSVSGAEIREDPRRNSVAVLEGKIEVGDFEKVQKFLFSNFPRKIYLASPGGDVSEAMKIGRLIRMLKLATAVPDKFPNAEIRGLAAKSHGLTDATGNYLCASACFFVFVAGVHRESDMENGILGIHRPYMMDSDLRGMAADAAISTATKEKFIVANYLSEMGVPTKYLDSMFAVPKDEVRWIDHDDFVADFDGFIPELKDWANARCDHRSDVDKKVWEAVKDKVKSQMTDAENVMADAISQKHLEQIRCESGVQAELTGEGYKHAIDVRSAQPAK